MNFRNRLRELRSSERITQKELGAILGLTANSICEWEKGRSEPSISAITKLSTYFNVSADYLLGRTDDLGAVIMPDTLKLSEEEQQILTLFRQMSKTQRTRFVAYGEGLLGIAASALKP